MGGQKVRRVEGELGNERGRVRKACWGLGSSTWLEGVRVLLGLQYLAKEGSSSYGGGILWYLARGSKKANRGYCVTWLEGNLGCRGCGNECT